MHVLIIPSDTYVSEDCPLGGIFQQHQARALRKVGYKVGVISIQLPSFELLREILFGWVQHVKVDNDQEIPVIRRHRRYWIPFLSRRFCHRALRTLANGLGALGLRHYIVRGEVWLVLRAGMALFQGYVREYGMPDLVHAHNAVFAGLLGSRIKNRFGVPYVITEHSSVYARGLVSRCQMPYVREAFLNADRRLVVSSSLGRVLERFLGNHVRPWTCVPNILDETFTKKVLIRKPEGHLKDFFYFLTIGRLYEGKGHEDLLSAFALKFQGESAVQLRIGGEGPLRKQLERQASQLGIDNHVSFLGELNREQVLLEMQSCNAFVLPSHYETFGVVLMEALSCGKPVISTKCGGPEGIVNSQNGMLVCKKNILALGEAMETMRMNFDKYDNAWIQTDCMSRFGESVVVAKLSNTYTEVCQRN